MALDSSQIDLPGSAIEHIVLEDGTLRVQFSRAYILKSMTGSKERTRWWQAGALVLEGVEGAPSLPEGPLVSAGGDIDENVYTYRDTVPIPYASRGAIRLMLRFEGHPEPLIVHGQAIRLEMIDVPRYIEHLVP
jgi:hypothetical protein